MKKHVISANKQKNRSPESFTRIQEKMNINKTREKLKELSHIFFISVRDFLLCTKKETSGVLFIQ